MADTFKFELVTPERMLMSQDAARVVVPGMEGQFTVLPDHAPVITLLRPGVVEVSAPGDRKTRIFVKGAFAEVDPTSVTVLAEHAWNVDDMDQGEIASELRAAEAAVEAAPTDEARFAAASAVDQLKSLQK